MPEPVLISEGVFAKGRSLFESCRDLTALSAPEPEADLAAAIRSAGARAAIVGVSPYRGRAVYEALAAAADGRGAILARFGVGHDSVDKALARQCGVVVTNTPGVLDDSVAEHAIWLLGSCARHIPAADADLRNGRWSPRTGTELAGKRLALIGFGGIARRAARIAGLGLGMHVTAVARSPLADVLSRLQTDRLGLREVHGVAEYTTDAGTALAEADAVSLHLPGNDQTRRFLDAARLARMKPSAILVNTARGVVVDESALYGALAAGRLAAAGLDVFEEEPYRPADPARDLRTLPNVVFTPHCGSNTAECNVRMAAAALVNVRHFLAGNLAALSRVDV